MTSSLQTRLLASLDGILPNSLPDILRHENVCGFPALVCSHVLESKSRAGFEESLFSLADLVNLEGVALNPGFTCSCVSGHCLWNGDNQFLSYRNAGFACWKEPRLYSCITGSMF